MHKYYVTLVFHSACWHEYTNMEIAFGQVFAGFELIVILCQNQLLSLFDSKYMHSNG